MVSLMSQAVFWVTLVALLMMAPVVARARIGERSYMWALSPEATLPVTLKLTLLGFTACDQNQRFCFDFPILTFSGDLKRPSRPGGSVSLAFAQAPLTAFIAMAATESQSRIGRAAALLTAWLSGGTARWSPGGEGNLRRGPTENLTLSLAARNETAFHPFVTPAYVRVSPGLGLALSRLTWTAGMPGLWSCGAGAVTSFGFEHGGRRSFDPGVWAFCYLSGD
jgi:hypothetical protein